VDVFVRKLRAKLDKHSPGWSYIHTHFGVGYRFEPEPTTGGQSEAEVSPAVPEPDGTETPASEAELRLLGT
jgi:hypothetical protein